MTLHSSEANSNVFTVSLLALITAVFYYPLLGAWFLGDDTQWMWFSAVNPLWKIFFDSDTYLYINDANFTPMLGLSFKIDWNLFHMNQWDTMFIPSSRCGHHLSCSTCLSGFSLDEPLPFSEACYLLSIRLPLQWSVVSRTATIWKACSGRS